MRRSWRAGVAAAGDVAGLVRSGAAWLPRLATRRRRCGRVPCGDRRRLDQISQVWRSDTSVEQRLDLADLDDLLEQLDQVEHETFSAPERVDELRGRIEVLMDEIEISLDIEPPVIASEDAGESDEEES
jgi:hypothetical protein